ncbi:DUF5610 domain-containing protein [Thalassomonas haliotis]|uniref:DUF5610 domain-containing protein n=1 Tax=Thalassomonas haliotis TaxID=485448 RepID=A0ABY7V934_9GAMM|nr:DUF5610 domain-containing protein [Thalassomonas haliotis]WDE09816.1 DUF5610 domain-containing protein [Thalassomonas haliotis]
MNINPIDQPVNRPLNKGQGKAQVAGDGEHKADKLSARQDEVSAGVSSQHKLRLGVQSLMSALKSNVTLGDSFNFTFESRQSVQLTEKQTRQLDKMEVEPFSFDFEAVAENVMEFVSSGIMLAKADGANDDKLADMLSQARSGIEQGFGMAREELDGLGLMTEELEQGINKSYDLLQSDLDDFEEELFGSENVGAGNAVNPDNGALAASGLRSQQLNMLEQEQGTINIRTRDGDKINIHFGSLMTLDQQSMQQQGMFSREISFSQSQSFSLQIEGELDDEELEAISSLVQDIGKLADNFFSGDIEKAWQQANELGFDDQQVAQVSLDFQEVKQVAVTEHYGRVPQQHESPFATLSPYLKDLESAASLADNLFEGNNLKELMSGVAEQLLTGADDALNNSSEQFVNFNQRLLDALS